MTKVQKNILEARQQAQHTLAAAQSRFVAVVSEGIEELMQKSGYSRERATSTLLRELGRSIPPPQNDEIFDIMTAYSLGVDDAAQAFTVSRAVGRAMQQDGLSAVEAIDELASKLSITKLLASGEPKESMPPRPHSPEVRVAPSTATTSDCRVPARKARKMSGTKPVHKNLKQKATKSTKNQSRKRPAPGNEKDKFSSRARADSVSEVVEAKAKKARLSPEESPETTPPANPIIVRKRTATGNFVGEETSSSAASNV